MRPNTGWAAALIALLALSWLTPAKAQTTDPHVHLVWADTGDPADPCHTGDEFVAVTNGETATATACVRSADETALDTSTSDLTLSWSLTYEDVATFTATPDSETDQTGVAEAELISTDEGSTDVVVSLCADPTCATVVATDSAIFVTSSGPHFVDCNDDIDNDEDTLTDYPEDPGCVSEDDNTEEENDPCQMGECIPPICETGSFASRIGGTAGSDVLKGTPGRDCIHGAGGNDVISGRGGRDLLIGGIGNDTIAGGKRADELRGGQGSDTLYGNKGDDMLRGGRREDYLYGGRGSDACTNGPHLRSCE